MAIENAMGAAHLHTPPSIFQHMMGQQSIPQPSGSWMQMSQVPSLSIPWSVPALQQPELVRFTGGPNFEPVLHQKRKLERCGLSDTIRQRKQFITEERIAARFQELQISSNYESPSSVPSTSTIDVEPVPSTSTAIPNKELKMDLDIDATDVVDTDDEKPEHPRLVFSEELKQLKQEPIIPSSLLSKLERPSMALVLWEPPSKHLRILPTRDTPTPIPSESDDDNNNNNNEAIPDLNQVESDNSVVLDFEPMEL